jgi:hypothetical protein
MPEATVKKRLVGLLLVHPEVWFLTSFLAEEEVTK